MISTPNIIYFGSFTLILVLFTVSSSLYSQHTVNAGGGDALSTSGTMSFSVGQLFFTYHEGSGGSIGQGVQHAYEISTHKEETEDPEIQLQLRAFPNPAGDFLQLSSVIENSYDYTIGLLDLSGRIIIEEAIAGNETRLFVGGLSPGVYLLRVSKSGVVLKTFKIVKI